MPFLSENVDLSKFSEKILKTISQKSQPNQLIQTVTNRTKTKRFSICSKEFCREILEICNKTFEDSSEEGEIVELDRILNGNTDLIPNQYEGGFKVWEGLWDLIDFLESTKSKNIFDTILSNLVLNREDEENGYHINILDLGCGSGLLSIYIVDKLLKLLQPKTTTSRPPPQFTVYLQDYNENVIKYFTIPNVIINGNNLEVPESQPPNILNYCRFLYGDWNEIETELLEKSIQFDLILTAETLYSEDNYPKLVSIFERLLRTKDESKDSSKVLIASKSHYFGVGGGTFSFVEFLEQNPKQGPKKLEAKIVHDIEAALLRNIIQIKRC